MTECYQYNINSIDLQVPLDPQDDDFEQQVIDWIMTISTGETLRLLFKNMLSQQQMISLREKIQALYPEEISLIDEDQCLKAITIIRNT